MPSSSSSSSIEPLFLRMLVRKNEIIAIEQLVRLLNIHGYKSKGLRARIDAAVQASVDLAYDAVETTHFAVNASELVWSDSDPGGVSPECVEALQDNWRSWKRFGTRQVLRCGSEPLAIEWAVATAKILRTSAWIELCKSNEVAAKTWEVIPDEQWRYRGYSCAALYTPATGQKTLAVFPYGNWRERYSRPHEAQSINNIFADWREGYSRPLEAQLNNILDYASLHRLGVEVYSLRIPGRRWPNEEGRFDKRQRLRRLRIERVLNALGIHGSRQKLVFGDGPDV